MKFKYKDLEININVNLESYSAIQEQKESLIRSYNFKEDGSLFYDEIIDPNLIELIPENPIEENFILDNIDFENNDNMLSHTAPHNPAYNSNIFKGSGMGTWINTSSGEFFVCTSKEIDKNIWVGQNGTKILPPHLTLDGIESNGLIAHFPLDSVKGNKVEDRIQGYIATKSKTSLKEGRISNCLYFKGSSYLRMDNESNFRLKDFTISLHLKISDNTRVNTIFEKDHLNEISCLVTEEAKLMLIFGDGINYKLFESNMTIPEDSWFHLAITRQGTNVQIYVNGTLIPGSINDLNNITTVGESTKDLYFGKGLFGGLKGYIDDIYIFNRELNHLEIEVLKDKGVPYAN